MGNQGQNTESFSLHALSAISGIHFAGQGSNQGCLHSVLPLRTAPGPNTRSKLPKIHKGM